MTPKINQKGATALGDVVAGDKSEKHYHWELAKAGVVGQLLKKLQEEVENSEEVQHTIEALTHYYSRRAPDGINGLKAKLEAGDRSNEYFEALEKKELFAKLLEKWSLYVSAQEIFAYLLAKAEYEFTYFINPQIPALDPMEINQLVNDRVVMPTIDECGSSVFTLNHSIVMGMVYWLAEQCFVRWHQ